MEVQKTLMSRVRARARRKRRPKICSVSEFVGSALEAYSILFHSVCENADFRTRSVI